MSKVKHKKNLGVPKASYAERLAQEAKQKEREKQQWTHNVYVFTRQETVDIVGIALHEVFGFGPERLQRFLDAFEETYAKMIAQQRQDQQDDADDFWYSTEKFESALKAAWGDRYAPRDKRYELDYVHTDSKANS